MPRITAHDVTVDPPKGWDGSIYRRAPEAVGAGAGSTRGSGPTVDVPMPIVHLANFALPGDRGDYGSGAVEAMGSRGVFISLLEHTEEESHAALFADRAGLPWPISGDSFNPNALQRRIDGQAGYQAFFTTNGRAFCLYVVIGSYALRAVLARVANDALGGLAIGSK